jgi:hypothetical protein
MPLRNPLELFDRNSGAKFLMSAPKPKQREVRSGSKTVLTPLKWDVCFTPRKQTSVSYAADCNVIVCSDGARLADKPPAPAPFG